MADLKGLKVSYFGDWVFYTGPNFIESPFEMMAKDCQLQFLGKPVTESLEKAGAAVQAFSNWEVYHFSPGRFEEIVDNSDLIIISDVEARCFHLNPDFFDKEKYNKQIITFPDRLSYLARKIDAGKGLIFMGGWLSFSGHMEKGGWRRCPISDWLPFKCLVGEDLVENSEGFGVDVVDRKHPITKDLPTKTLPPLLGYNEIIPLKKFHTLWRVAGTKHPLLGVSKQGKGRMVTYASDPVPHWGINLMLWEGYQKFWQNMAAWAVGR